MNKGEIVLETGTVIDGRYRLLRLLGEGGEGCVYLAMHEKTGRVWAAKIMEGAKEKQVLLWSRLSHPALPQIVDVIQTEEAVCLIMDYVEGTSLKNWAKGRSKIPEKKVLAWALQISEGLKYLHNQNPPIVYGDMKPENLMLKPNGQIVLVDFGTMARAGEARGQCNGTRGFAAPEQYTPHSIRDIREDIYGFGKTLQFLFGGKEKRDIQKLLEQCTQIQKEKRISSCKEFSRKLKLIRQKRIIYKIVRWSSLFLVWLLAGVFYQEPKKEISYEECMTFAKESAYEEQKNWCRKAVEIDCTRKEAYLKLVQLFGEDNVFSMEEERDWRKLFLAKQSYLKEKGEAYGEVCFAVGELYWFSYEAGGGKACASRYFSEAITSKKLDKAAKRKGEVFCMLGQSFDAMHVRKDKGASEYWKELKTLHKRVEEDQLLGLYIWYEKAWLIYEKTEELYEEGKKKSELEDCLGQVRETIQNCHPQNRKETELLNKLEDIVTAATESVWRIYRNKEG